MRRFLIEFLIGATNAVALLGLGMALVFWVAS